MGYRFIGGHVGVTIHAHQLKKENKMKFRSYERKKFKIFYVLKNEGSVAKFLNR